MLFASFGPFRNTAENGKYWYQSGKLSGVGNFIDGKLNGQQLIYFENGKIQLSSNYMDGQMEGQQKVYDQYGKVIKDDFYKNGSIIK